VNLELSPPSTKHRTQNITRKTQGTRPKCRWNDNNEANLKVRVSVWNGFNLTMTGSRGWPDNEPQGPIPTTTLSRRRGLRVAVTWRAMLAGASAPVRTTQARQVKW
jgi:hypothetical protein